MTRGTMEEVDALPPRVPVVFCHILCVHQITNVICCVELCTQLLWVGLDKVEMLVLNL